MTFWRGLKEAGLLEEVVEDFQKEIQEMLKGMQERITEPPLQVNGQWGFSQLNYLCVCG